MADGTTGHYAITGATGFVGGRLALLLRDRGLDVTALVRTPGRAEALAAAGVRLVPGDLADDDALRRLCEGVDGLFHVAGWYQLGARDPSVGDTVNVEGTRRVLAAAQAAAVPRVVYTSTLAVNSDTRGRVVDESYGFTGTHLSHYDRTKAEAHELAVAAARAGQDVVVVQPGLVYGPGDTSQTGRLIADVVAGRRPQVPSSGGVCWGYVDDIVTGHLLALERGRAGESYFLAGERATLAEGLRTAARVAGTRGPVVLPGRLVRGAATLMGLVERVLPLPASYRAETLRASLATYYGSPGRAQAELGWTCRSLRDGMVPTVRSLRPTGAG